MMAIVMKNMNTTINCYIWLVSEYEVNRGRKIRQ